MGTDNKPHAPNSAHPNCLNNVSEYEWTDAFYNRDLDKFTGIFDPNVTQSASTSPYTNFGVEEVADTFKWASDFYERCDFTYQASSELVEFLEFDLTTVSNMHMTGMTVLTKDINGKVVKVFNGHRNLMETVLFAEHFVKGPKNRGIVSLFHDRAIKKYGLELRYPRNPIGVTSAIGVTEEGYIQAFQQGNKQSFVDICDDKVRLSSNYLVNTIKGVQRVSECLEVMVSFYEQCIFTTQAEYQNRTYLLYTGRLRNGFNVSDGFLILVRDEQGKIVEILDNPIPMHAGTLISSYCAKHHNDSSFAEEYFYSEQLYKRAVQKYSLDKVYGKYTQDLSSYKGFIAQFIIDV